MERLRRKSLLLTTYLEFLLLSELSQYVTLITPSDPEQRGCQLSLSFRDAPDIDVVLEELMNEGVICDVRKPNVMRVTPTPLYNSFRDVFDFVDRLKAVLTRHST